MASAFALSSTPKNPGEAPSDSNLGFLTWESILGALQHPTYTAPSLKATLTSRLQKLQNVAQTFPITGDSSSITACSITIEGSKYEMTSQQKDLVNEVVGQAQLDTTEAYKIVSQQAKLGIQDIDSVMKAYMRERTAILRVMKCLLRLEAHNGSNSKTRLLAKEIVSKIKVDKEFVTKLLQGIKQRVNQQLPASVTSDHQYASIWSRQMLLEELELVEILFIVVQKGDVSAVVVVDWFELLRDSLCFSNQRSIHAQSESLNQILEMIQAMSVVISIRFTSLPDIELPSVANNKFHYFSNPDSIVKIHRVLKQLAPEVSFLAPVALNWALTMHRLFSSLTGEGEDMPRSHIQPLTALFETEDGFIEWHRFFAQLAFEQDAFNVITQILTTLAQMESCPEIQKIFQTLFFSTFHMIPFDDTVISTFAAIHSSSPQLSKSFWETIQDESSSPSSNLLFAVRSRFPLSFLPHLTLLVSSLHPSTKASIFNYFQSLPTYTQTLQRGFTGYDIIEEERDNTLITLRQSLRVFAERDDGEGAVIVQSGTVGRLLSRGESVPTVMWEWPFNGWALLGRVLETILMNGLTNVISVDESYVPILVTIFKLLDGAISGSDRAFVEQIVASTSEEMAQEWDVISVVYELVSQALEVLDIGASSHAELESLLAIAELGIKVLAGAVSGKEASIWPLIVKGGSKWWGRISRIGISAEMSSQELCVPITLAAIDLVDALFSAAIGNSILSDGFSAHLRREVLWLSGGYALDVWIGFNEWKYLVPEGRFEIGTKLCDLFGRIVSQVYTIDTMRSAENRITGIVTPTADRILDMFLSEDEDIARPFEALFYAGYVAMEVFESNDVVESLFVQKAESWCRSSMVLGEKIVRTRAIVSPESLGFELQIYRQLKLLSGLLSIRPSLRSTIFTLLRALVTAPQPENREQPSILAHLGGEEKFHIPLLIELVTNPLTPPEIKIAVWRYASGVMASQQQGLAILLLFGAETGRKTANKPAIVEDKEEKETLLRKAVNMVLEDELKHGDILERKAFDAVVEFVSKAHNSWAPILSTLRQDRALWAKLLILFAWSGIVVDTSDTPDQTIRKCLRLHTATASIDTIAVEIFHASNVSKAASIEVLRDHFVTKKDINLQCIASEAFRIRGYRDSLFFHLRRNFQNKFPSADILRLQRSTIHDRQFGEEYFFDISVGQALLGDDPAWKGFEKEIRLANLNMSIVDAQLELYASWQHLALAWDENGQKALPLEGRSVVLAKACLEANLAEAKMHALLRTTMRERAELAFSLIGNTCLKMKPEEIKSILRLAFNALVAPELAFFDALSDGRFDIGRPLLRTILTCLSRLDRSKERPSGLLLDIFEAIVTKVSTNLFNRARANPDQEGADMIRLVIAIGQEIVDLSGNDPISPELCNKLMDHNSIEAAVRLYGSGHQALLDDQPIFAELALQFMVTFSSAPRVPEQLAVAGILAYIMESPISSILQSADIRAPQNLILHRIWTRGVLPVIFCLLQSLGSRILHDAVAFLRLYEHQIQSAFTEWARPKFITTALVDETLLLLVLFEVTDSYLRIEQDRFVFKGKEDLLENVNNLLAHPRFLARLVHPTNLEEERLMEQRKEGEFRNGLVAKIATDLEEIRGVIGVVEQ